MKKFAVVLLVLSLSRIGVAYADTTNAAESQSYFFGTKSAAANLNQVLALLVGPQGTPGPAGVAGKDGLIGMDGKDGKDGLDGAPGAVGATGPAGPAGADGASVIAVAFTGAQGTCTTGGVRFTDGAGTTTYACNGLNGAPGATGAPGAKGDAGTGGGDGVGGFTYAQGELSGTCDDFIFLAPIRVFTVNGFVFSGFKIGDTQKTLVGATTNGGVESACTGQKVTFEFFTNKTYNSAKYSNNDHIICESNDILRNYETVENGTRILSGGTSGDATSDDFACRSNVGVIALADINTDDYTNKIGFSIG